MVNFLGVEFSGGVPPPYSPPGVPGFVTVTGTVPEFMSADPGIAAVSWFALTSVVVWAAPLKFTAALLAKLLPLTVKVKAAPAFSLLGLTWVMAGHISPFARASVFGFRHPPLQSSHA